MQDGVADLFDAFDLVKDYIGEAAAVLFAIALFASGQSSSLTASIAGQAVSQGFLQKTINPVLRRFVTRTLAVIPCAVVAATGGREAINLILIFSQVALSLILPFVTIPLLLVTSSRDKMAIWDIETNVC